MDNDPFLLYLSSLGDALEDLNLTTYQNQLEKKNSKSKSFLTCCFFSDRISNFSISISSCFIQSS